MWNPSDHYAYGLDHTELEAIMRFHAVKRWHMIDTTRIQTIAEHSANVAALAYLIADKAPCCYFGMASGICTYALFHDMGETFTGDVPTPSKAFGDIRPLFRELEQTLLPSVFQLNVTDAARDMVKLCDLADSIRFIRLHGVDVTARHARTGLETQYRERIHVACETWPREVSEFVARSLQFYAYEFS